jgi:hypothetical protein
MVCEFGFTKKLKRSLDPPGLLSAASENDLREAAARHLPPAYRALVAATRAPFLQTIPTPTPMRPPIGVVIEFPEMDKLIDRAGVALEIAD